MSVSVKRWIRLALAGVLVAALVYVFLQTLVAAAVGALVATLVTYAILRYQQRKAQAPSSKPDPRIELIGMLDGLVGLNIRMREEGIDGDVLSRMEGIVDKLRSLLEEMNERHPRHELTWTLNQMAKQYLRKITDPYLALTPPDRENSGGEILRSLDGLEAEIENVAELVQAEKMGDFKAKAAFLRARFVQAP